MNKILTKEIAEQFLGDPDGVELDEFTSIEDEAAEVLSKHQGELCLIECRFISTSAIELLCLLFCSCSSRSISLLFCRHIPCNNILTHPWYYSAF